MSWIFRTYRRSLKMRQKYWSEPRRHMKRGMHTLHMFWRLHKERGLTLVLVTHLMDDVADYADYVYALEKGRVVKEGTPSELFQDVDWLYEKQLGVPTATQFALKLQEKGMKFAQLPLTPQALADEIIRQRGEGDE